MRLINLLLNEFILWKHSGKVWLLLCLLVVVAIDRYQWHQRVMACIDWYSIYDYAQCEDYLRVFRP